VPIQSVVIRTQEDLEAATRKEKAAGGRRAAEKGAAAPAAAEKGAKGSEEIRGVFVIVNGLAEFRRVKPGIASDTDFEVTGDLKPGEKVIIGPHKVLRTLRPGQKVKIEEPKKPKGGEKR
jgi:hypothetical protein